MDLTNYVLHEGEQPLDRIVPDGGFTSIFRTIACIGDSLSSGEHESSNEECTAFGYNDYFEYSWGQYIARRVGCTVHNFSQGGMTSQVYMDRFASERGFWDPALLAQCYILAFGVNDLFSVKYSRPLGSIADIDLEDYTKNGDTFCGWYAAIIQRYKQMQPKAKFFLVTMPRAGDKNDEIRAAHAQALHDIAGVFEHTFVIDLHRYAPVYDEDFKRKYYLGGHMSAAGYKLTADMIMSYIDWHVRSDFEEFAQVGFIGRDVHHYGVKW